MDILLKNHSKIAIICPSGIGDGLIFMTLAYNLAQNGHHVILYSAALSPLANWFPQVPISSELGKFSHSLPYSSSELDYVFVADHSIDITTQQTIKNYIPISKKLFNRNKTIVDNLVNICHRGLHLSNVAKQNGITIPYTNLIHRQYENRIALHPLSADPEKNWPLKKFIQLAYELEKMKFKPVFIMSPDEREKYLTQIPKQFEIPLFNTLNDTAIYIYESGWMIGNDSAIGHLASNLKIPTLSLFRVKSKAKLWRPGFGHNQFVTPFIRIPGSQGRAAWKRLLSVHRVLRAFRHQIRQQL